MFKELNKAIMTRSRLHNKYLEEKSSNSKIAYDKQRNYCVNLLRRTKKKYFANINISPITDNRKFWKTVEPLFSNEISDKETINLAVNDTILSDDHVVADTFNNCFNDIVKNFLTVTNEVRPGTPLRFKSRTPGSPHLPSKFSSGSPGHLSKFKKEIQIMVFPSCFTYYILHEKLRNFFKEIIFHE